MSSAVPRPLTLSAMSLRHCALEQRLEAAAAAGFTGIGLRLSDYRDARRSGLSDPDIVAMLTACGLTVDEMETTWDWVAANATPGASGVDADQDELLHAARTLACPRINLASFFRHPLADIVAAFANLCDLTRGDAVDVGLEFLPYAQISHLSFALQVVEDAGRENGSVLLDTWHYFRSGSQLELLATVEPGRIGAVQINDVLPVPASDLKFEARHRRQLPGEGHGGLTELLRVLLAGGHQVPVTVEVFSDTLDDAEPAAAAVRLAEAGQRVLDLVGWP